MKSRTSWALLVVLATSAASPVLTTTTPALAADDTARARTLFQEGVQLEAAGNYAAALAKFQEVAQVKRTPQVVFHVALCQEKLGHWVEALGGYRIAAHEAGSSDDPKLAKVAETAQASVSALEKRIPTLTITKGKGAELAKVSVDGVDIGGATLGKAQQVDPGAHIVEASTPGKPNFKEIVQLAEGEAKSIEVKFPVKDEAAKPPPDEGAGPRETPPPVVEEKKSIAPYVVLGVGGASLLASGVFFLLRSSAVSDLDKGCHGNICPSDLKSTEDKGKTMTLLGNVTLGLGVVGVGVGTVMLLTQGPSAPEKPAPQQAAKGPKVLDVQIRPVSGGMGANLVGQF